MEKVVVLDYGLGNLFSIEQALLHVGCTPSVSSDPADLHDATHVVLPGVGAFGDAMSSLKEGGFIEPLRQYIDSGRPILGVCLGMQLLFDKSEEHGTHHGLGYVKGTVKRFPPEYRGRKLRIPQIGWNKTFLDKDVPALAHLSDASYFYFVHSYYVLPDDPADALTHTVYEDFQYCSSIQKNNIVAYQFHPEKSGEAGLQLYRDFLCSTPSLPYGKQAN